MPVLSVIACLHCAFYCWNPRKSVPEVIAVLLQVSLMVLVLHIRSTAIWQIHLIIAVGVLAVAVTWYRSRKTLRKTQLSRFFLLMWPAFASIVGVAALNLYREAAFPEEYFRGEAMLTRVFWHNIYSGFALHPKLAEQQSLRIDDVSVVAATGRYLQAMGRDDLWRAIGGESPNFVAIRWAKYDLIVRDMLASTCRAQMRQCAETFYRYKPYYFVDTMMWFYRVRQIPKVSDAFVSKFFGDVVKQQIISAHSELERRKLSAAPWGSGFLWIWILVVIGIAMADDGAIGIAEVGCMLATSVVSTGPSLLGYPAPHGMIDSAVVITATLQVTSIAFTILLLRRFQREPRLAVQA